MSFDALHGFQIHIDHSVTDGGLPLYSLLILAGLCGGVAVSLVLARRDGTDAEDVLFCELYAALGLIAGGKLLYLLVEAREIYALYRAGYDPAALAAANLQGGFVFYGGLFGALLMIGLYVRRYGCDPGRILRAVVPVLPLVHAAGRIGCLYAGCCYGREYDGPLAVIYSGGVTGGVPAGVPLFPVQLAEAVGNLTIFALLLSLFFMEKRGKTLLLTYFLSYGTLRFLLEFLRGDRIRGLFAGLSTSQWISAALILAVLGAHAYAKCRRKAGDTAAP